MTIPGLVKGLGFTLIIAVIFAPTILLFISAIKYKRVAGGLSSWIILSGGILLTLLSLNAFYPLIMTVVLQMNAQELAEASLFLVYASMVAEYLALLLLGIGMWMQAKRIQGILASKNKDSASGVRDFSSDG